MELNESLMTQQNNTQQSFVQKATLACEVII